MKQSAKDKKTHAGSLATVALIVVFIVGMLILLYPTVSTWWNERATTRAVFSYDEAVSALTEADYSSYEVDSIAIVLPSEMDYLFIEEGEDCVTLMTSTPYGISTHRLLVRGTRIENAETAHNIRVTAEAYKIDTVVVASIVAVPILLLLLVWLLFSTNRRNRKKRKNRS